jgi:hypothetical protein
MFRLWGGVILQAQPYLPKPFLSISLPERIDPSSACQCGRQAFNSTKKMLLTHERQGRKEVKNRRSEQRNCGQPHQVNYLAFWGKT